MNFINMFKINGKTTIIQIYPPVNNSEEEIHLPPLEDWDAFLIQTLYYDYYYC